MVWICSRLFRKQFQLCWPSHRSRNSCRGTRCGQSHTSFMDMEMNYFPYVVITKESSLHRHARYLIYNNTHLLRDLIWLNRCEIICFKTSQAQSASVAEIWVWQIGSWKSMGRLHSHSLTVTQLEFSHDNRFLLSVSRDRHFSIFSIDQIGTLISIYLLLFPCNYTEES